MKVTIVILFFFLSFTTLAQTKDSIFGCGDPQFPGGEEALKTFIKSNFQLIDSSLCQHSGTVYVQMDIDSTGKILNTKIKRGVKKEFDLEALRLCKIMPDWIPMICNGRPQKSSIVIPLIFSSK